MVVMLLTVIMLPTLRPLVKPQRVCHSGHHHDERGFMLTAAAVIGHNVRERRKDRFTAEQLGARIGELLGKAWPRQTVYLLEQGERKLSAEEVVALSEVLDVSVSDLFTPPAWADEVQVGEVAVPRERLISRGQEDGQHLYEVARHTQALRRSVQEAQRVMAAQQVVLANIDNALRGKPPIQPPDQSNEGSGLMAAAAFALQQDIERAQHWYEPATQEPFPQLPQLEEDQ